MIDLDRDPGTGARRKKWHSGFATKKDAERGLARLLVDHNEGTYVAPQKMTFGHFLTEEWLPAIEQTVRPTTYNGYRSHVHLYLLPRVGAVRLQDLAPTQFSALYRDLQQFGGRNGSPLTSSTVRRVHNTVHRSLRDAVQWGHLRSNPATGAVKPRQATVGSRDIATWTPTELKAFLDHLRDDRLFAMWRLAATTGMRRGELLGLRWTDVDLNARRVAVRQTVTAVSSSITFGEPKTKRGRRHVALDAETAEALVLCGGETPGTHLAPRSASSASSSHPLGLEAVGGGPAAAL